MVGGHSGYFWDSAAQLPTLQFTQEKKKKKKKGQRPEDQTQALTCGKQKIGGIQKEITDILLGYQEKTSAVKSCPCVTRELEIFR